MKVTSASIVLAIGCGGGSSSNLAAAFSSAALPQSKARLGTALALKRIVNPATWNYSTDFRDYRRGDEQYNRQDEGYYGGEGDEGYYDYEYDPYYSDNANGRLFGNSRYYDDSSEDFRRTTSVDDRSRRRDNLRDLSSSYARGNYGNDEVAFGGRRQYDGSGTFGYPDRSYGGDFTSWRGSEDFRRASRGRTGGGGGFQGNAGRNLPPGGRMQDYATPKQREIWQRQDNQGARYGWQQQYNTDRGNVRNGPSSDFRRGRSYNTFRTYTTPRERETRQMQDNQRMGRGAGGGRQGGSRGYDRNYDSGYNQRGGGYNDVRQTGYDYGYDGDGRMMSNNDNYYDPDIIDGRSYSGEASGRNLRNSWNNFKGFFNTGF